MTPRITDDAVSGLPLAAARAELLEEIMSVPVETDRTDDTAASSAAEQPTPIRASRSARRWVAAVGAAAAAAALVAVPSWLLTRDEPAPPPQVATVPTAREWVVLDAPGWSVDDVFVDDDGVNEVQYTNGSMSLQVNLRPADAYADYVEDRQQIDAPRVDEGTPVELLGKPARWWAYGGQDRTAIGEVDGRVFPEVRADGMGRQAYLDLLTRLSWTDTAGFEATLPAEFVTSDESTEVVAAMLRGIPLAPGAAVPSSTEKDPYALGADVAAQVVCPWLGQFEQATRDGDTAAATQAQDALAGSRDWAFLKDMQAEGGYPDVVWEMTDQVAAGTVPEGYREGLGCS